MSVIRINDLISSAKNALLHLAFPHVCEGCGTDILQADQLLCFSCLHGLPSTNFHLHSNNPVEKIFWGRLPLRAATAQYYFTKGSTMQRLMHQLKYKQNRTAGIYLGKLMGQALEQSNRFRFIDALLPLPLHSAKERKRGYNQAALLCEGIAFIMQKPVINRSVIRKMNTETQTRKGRVERWQNMNDKFELTDPAPVLNKHILLVDDVVTTGATLEACGRAILEADPCQLSIATLCFSMR